jgi:hypothetical protein
MRRFIGATGMSPTHSTITAGPPHFSSWLGVVTDEEVSQFSKETRELVALLGD